MKQVKDIDIKDYLYDLPDDKIAKYPLTERDESKLLIYKDGIISESVFKSIVHVLPHNAMLVFNNTKVIHARIFFQKQTGAKIELFCIEPAHPHEYQIALSAKESVSWYCIIGNAKRWKDGKLIKVIKSDKGEINLYAEKVGTNGDLTEIKFSWDNTDFSFAEIIQLGGALPIPPYLNRESNNKDEDDYQTIYAKVEGSVASPTAGLHFTEQVLNKLRANNIHLEEVTLHVGAGTFKPIKAEKLQNHTMHEEHIIISKQTIENLTHQIENSHPIVAVGTTSTRTLESLYWLGVKLMQGASIQSMLLKQWEVYNDLPQNMPVLEVLKRLNNEMERLNLDVFSANSQIVIAPGYRFRMVDILITNFHQPENTLILLIAAFVGDTWKAIYNYALSNNFRFLSYGDSSILFGNSKVYNT